MELKRQLQDQFKRWLSLQGDPELARKTFLFNLLVDREEERIQDQKVRILMDQQFVVLSKKLAVGSKILWILKAGPELK